MVTLSMGYVVATSVCVCECVYLYMYVCVNVCDQHLCLFCYLLSFSPCDVRLLAFCFFYLHSALF